MGNEIYLTSQPVPEVQKIVRPGITLRNVAVRQPLDLTPKLGKLGDKFELTIKAKQLAGFSLVLSNAKGEALAIGYDRAANHYFIDRSKSGVVGFNAKFAGRHTAPRLATGPEASLTLLFDAGSVELFADHGLTVMSELFFPTEAMTTLKLSADHGFTVQELTYSAVAVKVQ
ncbi:GH32 C-terminal domain-containing protein [Hymenobacter caeli]|uniref:GH32 C-terminal domain-containing protein n=1 Tax=Hymenobacter caeli TaxID=2735894 RepID=UPI00293BA2DA|nr:GH32 C-terminal domain-containing protein [Hymenobacter caeli]